jgi:hypothetical protein
MGKEAAMRAVPQSKWEWFGTPGHLCVAHDCRFHLTTKVGPWLISTVGEWVPPEHARDEAWMKANWPGQEIGAGRKYETYVFKAGERCVEKKCARCGLPVNQGPELDSRSANTPGDANRNHMALCKKWAKKEKP